MALYQVKNQWGGESGSWHEGGKWILGDRAKQNLTAIDIQSHDNGETFSGSITYEGEGPISFKGKRYGNNNYHTEVQWGGTDAPWHKAGTWVIGFRQGQNVIALNIQSTDNGKTFSGTMCYAGEGSIEFKANLTAGESCSVTNQWGGPLEPWHEGGQWALGSRENQSLVAIDIASSDNGKSLTGTMTYDGEGPIGFKATLIGANNYSVENQWGGTTAPWHAAGIWIIGFRTDQLVISLNARSTNSGEPLRGEMTYQGEGAIGFTATAASIELTEPA